MIDREPDLIFPYYNATLLEVRLWVDEGIIEYVTDFGVVVNDDKRSPEEVLEIIKRTAVPGANIDRKRRSIAENYLVERELLR